MKLHFTNSLECRWCHGTGGIPLDRGSARHYPCPDCGGAGTVYVESQEPGELEDDISPMKTDIQSNGGLRHV